MDASLIGAILGAPAGNTRLDMATEILRMNADSDGTNLDITA